MHWPQITLIALMALDFGARLHALVENDEEKEFWIGLFSFAILSGLLWCGGFWSQL